GLFFRRQFHHAPCFIRVTERSKDLASHTEIGVLHVGPFRRLRQAERKSTELISGHGSSRTLQLIERHASRDAETFFVGIKSEPTDNLSFASCTVLKVVEFRFDWSSDGQFVVRRKKNRSPRKENTTGEFQIHASAYFLF